MKIVTITSLKGGVGKSAIATLLADYLAYHGRVLLIDANRQGDTTKRFVYQENEEGEIVNISSEENLFENIFRKKPVVPLTVKDNLDLLVATKSLKEVEDYEPKLGKFSLYTDEDVIRVNYGVNSKTTFDSTWKKDTRKIKVVEGMCFIVDDIRDTFKKYWIGNYISDYDNKMNFCSNITKVYFKEMSPNVLNGDYDNKVEIDIEAQKKAIITDGLKTDGMTDLEILQYPTGDEVYLTGDVRFVDTMASLSLIMTM